ncbi:synaptic vesicular amine transporter-like isoform X5 [Branchiostoma floridae]|uniref:Synaptic vesicular amine transporter-like isoform X5 n=1 Tax=Branchiostoma floridae TaxID=7739 RepID=A0A9J7N130_BRAFL|nr:synaptic vesicular amine transporter-like isoform X5 [Branchiostoma floridae]
MIHKALPTLSNFRKSGALVLIVAFLAMFVDTMLTTVIRPIMPDYLYRLEHPNFTGAIITNPQRVKQLEKLSVKLGILYAASPAASIITNPVSAWLADRFGYTLILYIGMVLVFFSTIAFTFSTSFAKLFAARAVQGIGGSFSVIAAFMMLAMTFKDTDRAKAIGFSQSGMTIGLLVGPAIGGAMYESLGYKSPFLLIAGVTVVDGVLRLLQQRPAEEKSKENAEEYSSLNLLKDPYVLLAAAFIFVGIATAMMVGGMVPVWLMISMNASAWQQGVAILPQSVGYIIGSILSPVLVGKAGRWRLILVGSLGLGVSMTIMPLSRNIPELIAPYFAFGVAGGLAETAVLTEIGELADSRHGSKYGSAFAISETAIGVGTTIVNRLQGGEPAEDTVLQTSTWGGFLRIK